MSGIIGICSIPLLKPTFSASLQEPTNLHTKCKHRHSAKTKSDRKRSTCLQSLSAPWSSTGIAWYWHCHAPLFVWMCFESMGITPAKCSSKLHEQSQTVSYKVRLCVRHSQTPACRCQRPRPIAFLPLAVLDLGSRASSDQEPWLSRAPWQRAVAKIGPPCVLGYANNAH